MSTRPTADVPSNRRVASARLAELVRQYADRYGVVVPTLAMADVRAFARRRIPPGQNAWLPAALERAQELRWDLDVDEFYR